MRQDKDIHILCIWRKSAHRFKQNDLEILGKHFSVTLLYFRFTPACLVKMFLLMRTHDIAYAWFANVWAFFMVFFGKRCNTKTVIVAGGHDVANVPEINYGLPRHPILKHFAKYALKNADLVISVSKYNQQELLDFVTPKQNELAYNCFNEDIPEGLGTIRKKRVITAGQIDKKSSARKGHFQFLEVARCMPDVEFLHVGTFKDNTIDKLKKLAPTNVKYTGYLADKEYGKALKESKVYLQLSKHEAFGVSVVEAMAHGCTAVVSNAAALPEIVGSAGVVVETGHPEQIADKIRELFNNNDDHNEEAVKRAEDFSLQRRADKLIPIIRALREAK